MVNCWNCGAGHSDDSDKCSNCGSYITLPPHLREYLENNDIGLFPNEDHNWMDERGYDALYRSDGSKFIMWAWVCAVIAVICWFASMVIPTRDIMGNIDPAGIGSRLYATILAASFASLWGMLFGIGHIVRAIYFLPGNAMKACTDTEVVRTKKLARLKIQASRT